MWLQTYSGKAFYPLAPRIEDIDIEDIIHALAVMPRFTGHTRGDLAYSVAQHSIYVALRCPKGLELEGLLHDATEAWYHDIPAPLKHCPEFAFYRGLEKQCEQLLAQKFQLVYPRPHIIKEIDMRMLATEKRDLMGPAPQSWDSMPAPYRMKMEALPTKQVRDQFRRLYEEWKR